MVSVLALATAAPVYAQQYRETRDSVAARQDYERQRDEYEGQRGQYEDQRDQYREDSRRYEGQRRNYREARRDYDRRLGEWERARRIYDNRYGYGSYARVYSRPVWNRTYWSNYNPPPYAGYYGPGVFGWEDQGGLEKARKAGQPFGLVNEWHGPAKSIASVAGGRVYLHTGSQVLCLEGR